MLIEEPLAPGERRIVTVPSSGEPAWLRRVWYVLGTEWGVVTYEARPGSEHASVNQHARTNVTGNMNRGTDIDAPTCEFLAHTQACWFDGTSLAPAQPDVDAIWRLLETWATA